MSRPMHTPADAAAPAYRLANGLAYAINPLVLPPLLVGLLLAHFGATAPEIGAAVGAASVCFVVVPSGYLAWMVRTRRAATIEVRERRQRTGPLLVGLATTAAAFALVPLVVETAGRLVAGVIGCMLLNVAIVALVTRWWKVSLHTSSLAGFVSVLLFVVRAPWPAGAPAVVEPAGLALLAAAVPLIVWARVRTGAHTWPESVVGAAFGLTAPYAELALLYEAGAFTLL